MTVDQLISRLEDLKVSGVSGSARVDLVWWTGDIAPLEGVSAEGGVVELDAQIRPAKEN